MTAAAGRVGLSRGPNCRGGRWATAVESAESRSRPRIGRADRLTETRTADGRERGGNGNGRDVYTHACVSRRRRRKESAPASGPDASKSGRIGRVVFSRPRIPTYLPNVPVGSVPGPTLTFLRTPRRLRDLDAPPRRDRLTVYARQR